MVGRLRSVVRGRSPAVGRPWSVACGRSSVVGRPSSGPNAPNPDWGIETSDLTTDHRPQTTVQTLPILTEGHPSSVVGRLWSVACGGCPWPVACGRSSVVGRLWSVACGGCPWPVACGRSSVVCRPSSGPNAPNPDWGI